MRTWVRAIAAAAGLAAGAGLSVGDERATASGKVADAGGKPVEHATVLVYEAGVRKGYSIYCPTCWVDCGKHAVTDADGNYSIGGLNPDLVFNLLVVRDGFSATFVKKVDPAAGAAETAVLKPRTSPEDPTQIVRGLVVDTHGKPVRDAVVEQEGIVFRGSNGMGRAFGPNNWIDLMAVTNEKGEFEMAYGKPAEQMILKVTPRGMSEKLFTEPTGADRKTMTVSDGATIRGRLVQNGKPVADAEIGVFTHSRMAGTTFPEMRVGTREDGTFAITNIPPGRIWYLYGKMGSLAARGLAAELVECQTKDDGQEVDLGDIQVKPGLTLRGKVVLSDGKPIPADMHANLFADYGSDSQTLVLNADGRFEFKGLAKGVYGLATSVKGYRLPDGNSSEVLVDRDPTEITITMQPASPAARR
jgi:protocatechuate 3,4-dioxygenase beta subunit